MRQRLDRVTAIWLTILLSIAAFPLGAGQPAVVASDAGELLAGQPPESLAGKLRLAETPAVQGLTIERSARRIEVPAAAGAAAHQAVVVELTARLADGAQFAAELIAAEWVFRVAGEQDVGYAPLQHREQMWYESTFWQGGSSGFAWARTGIIRVIGGRVGAASSRPPMGR